MGVGIDFGGSKIEAVYLDAEGREHARMRIATPRQDYRASVQAVADLVVRLEREAGLSPGPVGIGIPGTVSPQSGLVCNGNTVWLIGNAFDRDIAGALGRPVRLENDANCFALSEARDGAAAGAASVFGVILGTGVGGGLVFNGKLSPGANGIAGEWGHAPLPALEPGELPGPVCSCGRKGCVEPWLSGPGLEADFARAVGAAEGPSAPDIVALAADQDPQAQDALERHADRLARTLAGIINIVDPEVIVLGGGLSNMAHLYTDLPGLIAPRVFADRPRLVIRPARFGDSSGVRGAARLWDDP